MPVTSTHWQDVTQAVTQHYERCLAGVRCLPTARQCRATVLGRYEQETGLRGASSLEMVKYLSSAAGLADYMLDLREVRWPALL